MSSVSVLIKPASGLCNMKCSYCFYADEMRKREVPERGMMTEETLRNVIRRTMIPAREGISYLFQGGEPTLRGIDFFQKAVELEKKYNRNHVPVQNALQTNGLLIDDRWCEFLKENRFLVGLSADGTKEIHDRLRRTASGKATFEAVCRAAEMLEQWEIEYNILTVVTPEIAERIEEIYRFYCERGWNCLQFIPCLDPLGAPHGQNEFSLSQDQYGRFLTGLFELWYADTENGTQPYIRQFENYRGMVMGYRPEACDMCGTCGIQYAVESDGSVYPCDFYMLDEYLLGNFNADRMDEIDRRRRKSGFIEQSGRLDAGCRECKWYRLCRGGCRRNREQTEKRELFRNYYCKSYRYFFEHCGTRLNDLAISMEERHKESRKNDRK